MIRQIIIWIAERDSIRRFIEYYGMHTKKSFARRFIAGVDLHETVPVLLDLYSHRFRLTLDLLGERVTTEAEAITATQQYINTLDVISKNKLIPHLSVKISQLGIDVNEQLCRDNLEKILNCAKKYKTRVRIDMESSAYTARTIDLYYSLRRKGYDNVDVTAQAYLHRSFADVSQHIKRKSQVRLCKGAYLENAKVAFTKKKDVDRNYVRLMLRLIKEGAVPAIATHDENMINAAKAYARVHNIPHDRFEFELLYGIRRDLAQRLVSEGFTVRLYVPFGRGWYPYFIRRILERPANVWFVIKNIIQERFQKRTQPSST